MSQYMYFSISRGNGDFIPLIEESRSNSIYVMFYDYANYGEFKELTPSTLKRIKEETLEGIKSNESAIKKYEEYLDFLVKENKSIDDLRDEFWSTKSSITEIKYENDSLDAVVSFINTLERIMEYNEWEDDENKKTHIWFGIETGFEREEEEDERD